jgi:flagellar hook-associated protein 3 FlgL
VANPADEINGDDVAPVAERGVVRYLFALRDALLANDSASVSRAGAAIQGEIGRVARSRGSVGVRMQSLDQSKQRIEDEVLQVKGLLSEVRDLDYASALSRFNTLQTTFQASLQTAANVLPMSLMDFLRM